jgi:uncharacterized protein (DUF1501 family)
MRTRSRRHFLKSSLTTASLVGLAPTVPGFLARTARGAEPERDGRVLVVIQLDGGNDGINTIVPFRDEGYAKHRKVLRLPVERLIKVDDQIGLHPAMSAAATLLESGRLAIVPGVGYPNPNRSHFESMAIWQSARLDQEERASGGWLGRGLDGSANASHGTPAALFAGSGALPVALRGRRTVAAAIDRPEDLELGKGAGFRLAASGDDPSDAVAAFVSRTTLEAYTTADRLRGAAHTGNGSARYPDAALAQHLRLVAAMLKADFRTRVFYTMQTGYDTHAGQLTAHAGLLESLSTSLLAFLDDLAAAKLADRVLILCFSEFGRRVAENGSAGTDHGTAGPVLLAGPCVRPGVFGHMPSLIDLDEGDLKSTMDFRRVYATLLERWLGLASKEALGGAFDTLPLLRV